MVFISKNNNIEELTEKLKNEPGTVCYVIVPRFVYFIQTKQPNLMSSLTFFGDLYRTFQGFLIRKNCPHTRMINEGIRQMQQIGIIDKLYSKWFGEIYSKSQVSVHGFSFGQATICFIGLGVVYLIVFIVIVLEVFWFRLIERQIRKRHH